MDYVTALFLAQDRQARLHAEADTHRLAAMVPRQTRRSGRDTRLVHVAALLARFGARRRGGVHAPEAC